ncbi:hypothetical protein PR370_06120 [Mycobacterium marinum]|uniref:hypothetical protein n=1 Tax=Mycobacterium marinum TaxID=1781 RepID=UPI0023599678|nr:hypothetical protein [Mycobacterium marinum]MDC8982157.1 hypothetical protein [Mycobacterium marinum]MDC8998879.1 hypothetical protein [Mycobacterium marinum]MDC9009614.1 hypothetical protein [Mycobacterium marinum]
MTTVQPPAGDDDPFEAGASFPVDSTIRSCCFGIGGHAQDCQGSVSDAHGCRFDWCENTATRWDAQRLEHFRTAESIPATGNSLRGVGRTGRNPDDETIPTVSVGIRFNEDVDPAPTVFIGFFDDNGARDAILRVDEAVLVHNALGRAIINGCKGTNLSPQRTSSFYSSERA